MSEVLLAGRYELGAELGRGGMSVVHAAVDRRLQRPVAVKTLRPDMAERPDVRRRFEGEARWSARLSHPSAVAVYDTGEHDGVPFLVMERLPGDTLADRIAAGPVDPDWIRQVALDVLDALEAAHEVGIVHRDVKPANILLTAEGRAKVSDFGIAKALDDDSGALDLTGTGQMVGTPSYLAPERLDGEPATVRSDIYGLGVVLYEALTGARPFPGTTPLAVAVSVKHARPAPLAELRPGLDPPLVRAVERAMSVDPDQRFASAQAMAADLRHRPAAAAPASTNATRFIAPHPTATMPAPARPAPARPRRTRRRWPLVVLLLLFVAGAAGLIVVAARRNGGGTSSSGGDAALVRELRSVADRVEVGDGPRGPEAANRLRAIAGTVAAGGAAGDPATALLRDAQSWHNGGELYNTATGLVVAVVRRVPGVDATVLAPAATDAPAPPGDGGRKQPKEKKRDKRG